jgi:hypothetical protein
MIDVKATTGELIDAYYSSWGSGIESFDARRLRELLADDVYYESPIAGDRQGVARFVADLMRIAADLRSPIRIVKRFESDDRAAIVYDASLPQGSIRFAEFIDIAAGRIRTITQVFDAGRYQPGGRR